MSKIRVTLSVMALFIVAIFCAACTMTNSSTESLVTTAESASSGNTGKMLVVVTQMDADKMNLSFREIGTNEDEIYPYNKGTMFYSKSGKSIAGSQIKAGDIIDLYFDSGSHLINKMQISTDSDVWENTKVTSFSFDDTTHSMTVGQSLFSYNEDTLVVSDDKEISVMELNSMDQLTVRGYGNKIISITVDKGHGYVKLKGDDFFVGGLVNIDGIVAKKIEKGMMIIVTEGTHKLSVVNGKYSAEKNVTIERDENSEVDFSDIQPIVTETGNVKVSIDISGAVLYVDGTATDYASILTLTTGEHTLKATAKGYADYTGTIKVATGFQTVKITMNVSETTSSTTETKKNTETTAVPGETKVSAVNDVTISGPVGGTVYFDGAYKGVAPVTFDMVTGTHVVSILYNGSIKSYTVNLAEGGDNVKYDFTNK